MSPSFIRNVNQLQTTFKEPGVYGFINKIKYFTEALFLLN